MERAKLEQGNAILNQIKVAGDEKNIVKKILKSPNLRMSIADDDNTIVLDREAHKFLFDLVVDRCEAFFEARHVNLQKKFDEL